MDESCDDESEELDDDEDVKDDEEPDQHRDNEILASVG